MGQLLTISILGGACFGMPTALVAERERGVWRRYRLLPVRVGSLLVSTMLARFVIVLSAGVMQILLARLVYGTPFPLHPAALLVAFTFVVFSFLGLGSVIAALANDVPAVQALGQCVFLPMIMIGGVGVPLRVLPDWAQTLAGFMPGRYAVALLDTCIAGSGKLSAFNVLSLTVIGFAAFLAGAKMFRWDANQRVPRQAWIWVMVAIVSWLAVGFVAKSTGRLPPQTATMQSAESWTTITPAQIASITFDNLPPDDGTVSPLAKSTAGPNSARMDDIISILKTWPPGKTGSDEQRVRNLLSAAAVADVTEDPLEARFARAVLEQLRSDFKDEQLQKILTYVILNPQSGTVITTADELNLDGTITEEVVRKRVVIYATKFLRLLRDG